MAEEGEYDQNYEYDQQYNEGGEYDGQYDENYQYNEEYYTEGQEGYNPDVISWATAIYSYEAQNEGELSFQEGDWVGIIEEYDDGWSKGDVNGVTGIFPSEYVQKTEGEGEGGEATTDTTYTYSNNQPASNKSDDPQAIKRRERRQKLIAEFKVLKEQAEQQAKIREQLEKDIKVLTETKQKLKKDLRHSKATMGDTNTILFDLIKLVYSMDVYTDAAVDLNTPTMVALESLNQFNQEFQKEGKSSPALVPFIQKISPKVKDIQQQIEQCKLLFDEGDKAGKDFYNDLFLLTKSLEKRKRP